MSVRVVPKFPNFVVDEDDVIVTYDDVLNGGFDVCVATVLEDILRKERTTIHSNVIVFGRKTHNIEAAGTQRTCMNGAIAVLWRDNKPPSNARALVVRRCMTRVDSRP